jgi:hypothetical protein
MEYEVNVDQTKTIVFRTRGKDGDMTTNWLVLLKLLIVFWSSLNYEGQFHKKKQMF